MKRILITTLSALLLLQPFCFAATVYFDDGRIRTGCDVEMSGGAVSRVTDKTGTSWAVTPGQKMQIVNHPFLNRIRMSAAAGLQSYSKSMAQRPVVYQQNTGPKYFSCNPNGSGGANCYGY